MKFSWSSHNTAEDLKELCQEVERLQSRWDLSKKCGFSLQLTIDELFNNLIMHTVPKASVEVTIELLEEQKEILVTVIDDCPPFDPLQLTHPHIDAPLEEREIGGLGIFLIRKKSKRFEYERKNNQNILKITLYKD